MAVLVKGTHLVSYLHLMMFIMRNIIWPHWQLLGIGMGWEDSDYSLSSVMVPPLKE